MDVQKKLDEIVEAVGGARSMPMSASCVVNRAELLAMLEQVRQALPGSLAQARELIGGQEQLVEQARQEAERIIEGAHAERGSLISDTQVARRSQDEADRILADARREAEEIRAEADDYVDSKLANFEVVLTKTIGSVDRGREKLLGRGPGLDQDGYADDDAPEYSADPAILVQRADGYVDAKLGAFEAVLSKTLEAVGRGRLKLHGRTTSDALGEHMAAQDAAAGGRHHASDAEYLAGLAELADAGPVAERPSPAPAERPAAVPEPRRGAVPLTAEPTPAPEPLPALATQPLHHPQAPPSPPQQPAYAPTAEQPPPFPDPYDRRDPYDQRNQYDQQGGHDPFAGYQAQDAYPGYQQDPYAGAGYQQQGYDPQPYAPQTPETYGGQYAQQDPYAYQQQQQQQQQQQPAQPAAAGLDETSLFDTSMIDLDQLRRYEQGR